MSKSVEKHEKLGFKEWAEALRNGDLLGQECVECGHVTGAPKAACAHCGSRELETVELPEEGEVYSVTRIEVVPEGFEEGYDVGIIQLGDARLTARLEKSADIGDEVEFTGVIETDEMPAPVFG
ncbi:MAG: zinc ribbon domain-containing protein [Halobacteria archaeon]|nr:zinc ribbon domain-containing protein [Halobacteria archaeon]